MTETLPTPAENGQLMRPDEAALMERVITLGDLGQLTAEERVQYYFGLCRSLKLNAMARPFGYIVLNNKLTLYALKECSDQLRRVHQVSITNLEAEAGDDLYTVTATARTADGRMDMDQGVVNIAGLRGEALANARMKAVTKAKRRVTLSLCGLSIPDESEIDTIPNARTVRVNETTGEILEPAAALPPAPPTERDRLTRELGREKDRARTLGVEFTAPRREASDAELAELLRFQRTANDEAEGGEREQPAEEAPAAPTLVCADCGKSITTGQAAVSQKAFGRGLCPEHQRAAKAAA